MDKVEYCPILGLDIGFINHARTCEFDHKNNDRTDNSLDNCNPLSHLAHAIKTTDVKQLRLKLILEMIKNTEWTPEDTHIMTKELFK